MSNTKKDSITALIMATVAMAVSFMVWASLSPVANQIAVSFDLSASQKSLLIATPVLLGSIMRIPMGILSDRLGGKKVYIGTMIFIILPLIFVPMVQSFPLLILLALLLGMAGTTFAIAISYVSAWFPPEKQGLILGIAGMGNIGNALAGLIIPQINSNWGFDWIYYSLIIALIVIILLFATLAKEMPISSEKKTLKQQLSVVKDKNTWFLSLFYFLTFGSFVALSNYLPSFMSDQFLMNPVNAGLVSAAFAAVATLMRPVGGVVADKMNPTKLLSGLFICVILFALGMAVLLENYVIFTTCIFLTALAVGLGNGVVFKMVPMVSKGNTGAVTGFVGAAGGLGGFFPPLVLGAVKESTGSFALGFVFLGIFACICLIVVWMVYIRPKMSEQKI
ncbi:nitrate/nitrite transporter [Listeria fleischmannii]|jgi:nitrate/nitrite transporter NarK|uniref:NarK/NasA family nitrate transporter n=1 Tax=Listeria fleischmannii TaxID=1069827 RepID=A0A841YGD9_9LIST|nr:MFS transporter [Listeria fleischmannii]EIA21077.1 nitrite extrusion protein [Listeria fleischmannii subsp. coloradonensis]MBC1399293.1 NarK/NasA family nitrate transporter [Listeria fleischmannii]MBC1427773.1 NarK/NasA family nitrate transporter [Listeria fleischmannii]STY35740.1 Probable nitrate transporter narT [Listeria fleischmannii subsp. coloradonensis]